MVTIESKQNATVNRRRVTIYDVRENGLYKGQYSVKGWNASDSLCLSEYHAFFDYSMFFDYCSE